MSILPSEKSIAPPGVSTPLHINSTSAQLANRYSSIDHAVWHQLYTRQTMLLQDRASDFFIAGLARLDLSPTSIPTFKHINRQLKPRTGWEIVEVPGLVSDKVFFEYLANRCFPVTWWIRCPDQIDYLEEPDCFHDLFGHVPLLSEPAFADYMQAYGAIAHAASNNPATLALLARLYWYTVEFGLICDQTHPDMLRIYGAGIVSSKTESLYSLESSTPNRLGFNLERVMLTHYQIDTFQKTYFVIDDFSQLFNLTAINPDTLTQNLAQRQEYEPDTVLNTDAIYTCGTANQGEQKPNI